MNKINKKLLFACWAGKDKFYSIYQFYHPLKKMFKHVVQFDPKVYMYKNGQEEMNKKFLEIVKKEKPDYIFFWIIYDEFYLDTLLKIKEISPKTKTINLFSDDDTTFANFSRFYALFFDYILVFQKEYIPRYIKEGVRNVFFYCGVNCSLFSQKTLSKEYDVTFVGTPKTDRHEIISYLKENGVKIMVYGAGWEKYPEFSSIYGGKIDQSSMVDLINKSRINLSFTKNYMGNPHIKGRVFEIAACKSFQLVEYYEGYLDLFKNEKEIIMFKNKEDLLKKIKEYLGDEKRRDKIAGQAYNRVISFYSYEKQLDKIFRSIVNDKNKSGDLPKINKKIANLSFKEIYLDEKELENKLKEIDYVCFVGDYCKFSPYKSYLQTYSLGRSKKNVSCCDCYFYSKCLGDYLAFLTYSAFLMPKNEKFFNLLDLSQIMVNKNYFISNIKKFREFYNGKNKRFIERDIAFVSLPLIRIEKIQKFDYKDFDIVFYPKFENNLRTLIHKKRIFRDPYLYNLLVFLITNNIFFLPGIIKRLSEKVTSKFFSVLFVPE